MLLIIGDLLKITNHIVENRQVSFSARGGFELEVGLNPAPVPALAGRSSASPAPCHLATAKPELPKRVVRLEVRLTVEVIDNPQPAKPEAVQFGLNRSHSATKRKRSSI